MTRLLLWDVDGTLVRTGPVGSEVFDLAMADVVGRVPSGRVRMSGKTDPLIVREHLVLLGVEPTDEVVAAVCERLVTRLAEVRDLMARTGSACPGAAAALEALGARPGVVCGVLTGNLEPNARVKLAAYGLDELVDFQVGAFGSDDADRDALVPIALRRAAERLGGPVDPDDTWVIGDTPRDLACARAGGAHCLLVATGTYPADELAPLGADATLTDLTDTEAVVKLLVE
ncbi:MAG TPA: haloacid dehalogenase-like hydrolase [Acidimicrobiales bacterium]|nr:haloacid dehalogenase-like hydrolase [Acidimicrobiales bacterium]